MDDKRDILQMIKKSVLEAEPGATIILYGSYARGEQREDSDIDLLILIDREKDRIPWEEQKKIISPISRIEIETNTVISSFIYTRKKWANHRVTPYYENVNREGIIL